MRIAFKLLSSHKHKNYFSLFCYHFLFIVFAYFYRIERGSSDSNLYWFRSGYTNNKSWLDFAQYGTDFILFLNYPLTKIGLPFWFGYLLYGCIGFFGILKWMQWAELIMKDKLIYKGFNLLYLFFFLPNIHFWTASLGKEALVFWGIASVIYAITDCKNLSFSAIAGGLMVLLIRPHVALMLFFSIGVLFLLNKKYSLSKRFFIGIFTVSLCTLLLFMVFQLSHIRYWNWERITYFNEYSILSFRNSGSYVPMLDYTYLYKLFSFNFRPLFYDVNSIMSLFASFENLMVLMIFVLALFIVIRYYPKIKYTNAMKTVFLFSFIASVLYVERYANLGIFMRTKMMFQPFLIIALIEIIRQGFLLYKPKH